MTAPHIVLDTNCLFSSLLFEHSRLSILRNGWQSGKFIPLGCKETVNELIRALAYPKFKLSQDEIKQLLADVLPFMETHVVSEPYAKIKGLTDMSDAVFVHLAHQAKADCLVSGDARLLVLKGTVPPICSPADFLPTLSK
jgi:putative PIN family toxin of toxin-antitoxin system